MDHDKSAFDMVRAASATGKITRTSVNLLARTFVLLGRGAAEAVRAIDKAIVDGVITIVEDGDTVHKHPPKR